MWVTNVYMYDLLIKKTLSVSTDLNIVQFIISVLLLCYLLFHLKYFHTVLLSFQSEILLQLPPPPPPLCQNNVSGGDLPLLRHYVRIMYQGNTFSFPPNFTTISLNNIFHKLKPAKLKSE